MVEVVFYKGFLRLDQNNFRKLISGENSGLAAVILRFLLAAVSLFYAIAIGLRDFLYSKGFLRAQRVDAPVISIGNITTGGTGKTPLVIWMCKFLQKNDIQCAILTRGYKTQATSHEPQTMMDEPAILAQSCPQVKVIVNPDRVAGAAEAMNSFGAKVMVMDDGFQHRRLARDLDIITIDATCPFGYGKMLPAGLLREPLSALGRANAVVITRCDQADKAELNQLEEKIKSHRPDMITARSIHKPVCAKSVDGKEISLEELKNKKIFAFCGIGNPEAFLNTIKALGLDLAGAKIYDDHYYYTENDIDYIYKQAWQVKADLVITTQKDLSKLNIRKLNFEIQFAYLAIELKFICGEDKITQLIEDTLAGKIPKK